MTSPLKAGSVAIGILGDNTQILQVISQTHVAIEKGLTEFPGFQGRLAVFRDFTMTIASLRGTFQTLLQPLQQVFTSFSSFEFGMSKVQAITNATAESIGKLREQAKELGRTTFFTATQVADAQKFLAMAGFNPEQIEKATPQVLNLALAGDMDLGTAADIATNISTPFKIAAEDLVRVNDVLAKAVTSSNSNMMELGQAFKYAAPAASAAGQSIEECGSAMAILANNGIKADTAGTSLRMMMIKLADAGIQAKLKEQFDIDVSDVNGKMRPLLDVLDELKLKTNGLGQTQQMSAFYDIFEQRAGTSALVLGSAGDAIADYRMKMVDAAGTSAQMSKAMADNIKGDWIAFTSAIEGVQIAIGETLNTFSRDWLKVFTSATRSVAEFVKENKDFITSLIKWSVRGTIVYATLKTLVGAVKWLNAASASYVAAKAAETAAETANSAAKTSNFIVSTWKISADGQQLLLTNAVTAATGRNTVGTIANTVAKKANLLLTKSLSAATLFCTNALKALTISMAANPMMWIGAAVVGLAALVGYLALANEYQAKLSNTAVETSTKNNDTRNTDDRKFQYLDQLLQKQELTNKEMQNAEKIIGELQGRYGDLGLSIDKTTGKIIKAADAQKKLNEEMNKKALQDAEAELAEGERNFVEFEKQKESYFGGIKEYINVRDGWGNTGFGSNMNGWVFNSTALEIEKISEQQREQTQKNHELRKKIAALKGGEDWRDVNNPDAIVSKTMALEQENTATLKELENAEKRLQEMQDTMRRDEQTAVQNEIEDIRNRNDEYDKYQ